jgi:hypothetical protein
MFTSSQAGDCLTTNSLLQITNSQAGGHLTPTAFYSHRRLKTLSNGNWPSLYSLGTDRTENTTSSSYSITFLDYPSQHNTFKISFTSPVTDNKGKNKQTQQDALLEESYSIAAIT